MSEEKGRNRDGIGIKEIEGRTRESEPGRGSERRRRKGGARERAKLVGSIVDRVGERAGCVTKERTE